jgi:hypothetical protein
MWTMPFISPFNTQTMLFKKEGVGTGIFPFGHYD